MASRQARAIAALLQARNLAEAAHMAGVSGKTLARWMAEPAFRAALLDAEGQAIDAATRRLVALQAGALDVLEAVLSDTSAAPGVRLRAVQAVLDNLVRLRELRSIEERLAALEAAHHDN